MKGTHIKDLDIAVSKKERIIEYLKGNRNIAFQLTDISKMFICSHTLIYKIRMEEDLVHTKIMQNKEKIAVVYVWYGADKIEEIKKEK